MGETAVSYPSDAQGFVTSSYRYLRLAMVVLAVMLAVSVVIEIVKSDQLLGSISVYYYTPVHSLFVGALLAVGVSLVALRGSDVVEDLFFNLAGAFAVVVALVPTAKPAGLGASPGGELSFSTKSLVSNNVVALVICAALALVIAVVILLANRQDEAVKDVPLASIVGMGISAGTLLAGVIWYRAAGSNFEKYAHGSAAVAMFVAIWLAVLVNAGWPQPVLAWIFKLLKASPQKRDAKAARYAKWYGAVAAAMALVAAAVLVTITLSWDQRVFWLEVGEIVPFIAFWVLQTTQAWREGVVSLDPGGTGT